MHPNAQLIERFYTAFQHKDYAIMQACYHDEAVFNDPAFGKLDSAKVKAMWQMLLIASKDLKATHKSVQANNSTGSAHWEAWYSFSRTGRQVHNIIEARFEFKDGKIFRHTDTFNFYRWSKMAFGPIGVLLGWTSFFHNKVSETAIASLKKFMG